MIRKIAFSFLLMLICSVAASATDITISTFTINNFQRPGTTAQVRIWYSANLVDSLGQPVLGGPVGSSIFKIVSCRLDRVSKVLTIPAFTIPSTNDSSAPNARVTARIYDSAGRPVTYLWTRWIIPYQLGTPITFAQLSTYNAATPVPPGQTYPTTGQVSSMPAVALTGPGLTIDAGVANLINFVGKPSRFGLSSGTFAAPTTSNTPVVAWTASNVPPKGLGGTNIPYYFGYYRKNGGTMPASSAMLVNMQSYDTLQAPANVVGISSFANAVAGSTSEPFAFWGIASIHDQHSFQGAVGMELEVQSDTTNPAPALTTTNPDGYTIGLNLVGGGTNTNKYNSAAILFQAADGNAFKTLIHVNNNSIAPGGYGLDFKYATRGLPIRLPNLSTLATGYIYGRNNADNADKKLLGITSGDLVSIDGDGVGIVFGGGISLTKTITPAGTTGAQTVNKTSGSVNFSAGTTSLVVANSFALSTSVVQCTVATNDLTMKSVQCVAGSGSLTIFGGAAPTAETRVNFTVTN